MSIRTRNFCLIGMGAALTSRMPPILMSDTSPSRLSLSRSTTRKKKLTLVRSYSRRSSKLQSLSTAKFVTTFLLKKHLYRSIQGRREVTYYQTHLPFVLDILDSIFMDLSV